MTDADPLVHDLPFTYEQLFYPLGFPLRLRSNSTDVLKAAEKSWRDFSQSFDVPAPELSFGVATHGSIEVPPLPLYRARGNLMSVTAGRDNFAVCDFNTGFGYGWVTPAVLADDAYFRFAFLEAVGYSLISERQLAPVHAACVAFDGCGFLLCGPSEAGKSSFSYACARRGWTYIADDGSFLARSQPGRSVVGNPYRIRFRTSAISLFPELSGHLARARPNGKMSIEVDTKNLPGIKTALRARIEHVVFLNREPIGPVRLSAMSKEEAFRRLRSAVSLGDDQSKEEQRQALWNLLVNDPLELEYSDFSAAIDCLERLVTSQVREENACL